MFATILKVTILNLVNVARRLFKQDLILYSSGFNSFSGHVKYEYLERRDSENAFWVSSNREEFKKLNQLGYSVVLKYTTEHFYAVLRAKMFVISHNISDIFPVKPAGCLVVNLWHGVAIKSIGFDSPVERVWIENKLKSNDSLPYDDWDQFIAQSEYHKKIIVQSMRIEEDKILVREPASHRYLKNKYNERLKNGSKIKNVLYMPTFRSKTNCDYDLSIKKIMKKFNSSKYRVSAKFHPLVKLSFIENYKDLIIIDANIDAFELLASTDVLVSDYSSVVYDYIVTGGQIFLIHDDIKEYTRESGDLYEINLPYGIL